MKIKEDPVYNVIITVVLVLLALCCVLPLVLLFAASLSSEAAIAQTGYSFWPKEFSLKAYQYLWQKKDIIGGAYMRTIVVTAIGTTVNLFITTGIAYPISRPDYPLRKVTTALVLFSILFNGGLVPTYLMYTQIFKIKNTIWALLVPNLMMNGFNVLIARTYFKNNIPSSLLEAARIDGAGEFTIYRKVVLPISLPIMATVGLLAGISYWNDWSNGFVYITETNKLGIQSYLARIIMDLQFLTSNNMGSSGAAMIAQLPTSSVRMAIAVVGVLPVLIIYPFFQKYFVKGITIGSVKE